MIDWQFLFLAWELKGKYPAILDQPVARELFDDANTLLDEIIADGSLEARGAYGFWPAHARRRRHRARRRAPAAASPAADAAPADRRSRPAGPTGASPTTSRRPATTSAGSRSPSTAPRRWPQRTRPSNDDYRAIMVKALADRLAEAFAEYIHLQARRDWFEPDADPAIEDLHAERFRGIRPALGYPASPDHSQKQELFDLLDAEQLGMALTESFAMTPAASVSGLIFAHPASRYFTVGPDRPGPGRATTRAGAACRPGRGRALAAPEPRLRPPVNPVR